MRKTISLGIFVMMLLSISIASANNLTIRPNAQGNYAGWTNSGCSAGTYEWQCVDETPASSTDSLYTTSKNVAESFAFQDTGLTNQVINSVTVYYYAIRAASNRYQIQPLIRSGGTDYLGSIKALTSSYAYYTETYTTNPATGAAWTIAEVNALEAGMKSYGSNYGGVVAQVYAVVDYTPVDTCTDTDGYSINTFGNVYGYLNLNYYSYDDYCVDSTTVLEYYCLGGYSRNFNASCATNTTTTCSGGRCI